MDGGGRPRRVARLAGSPFDRGPTVGANGLGSG